jgi:mannose-6-phosphate isomerase-like protein (cupin superfamily)
MHKTILAALLFAFLLPAADKKSTATYVTKDDLQATLKRAPENSVSDQQIRVVDAGKANVAIGVVNRPGRGNQGAIEHDQVTEVYQILEGSGTLVTGGDMTNPQRRKPDDPTVRDLVGPSVSGAALENGESRRVGPGDLIIIPAGVPHWFSSVDGSIRYVVVRVDTDKLLPAK